MLIDEMSRSKLGFYQQMIWTVVVNDGKRLIMFIMNLVGGLVAMNFIFPEILGISSSQLTNSNRFQRGGPTTKQWMVYKPPVKIWWLGDGAMDGIGCLTLMMPLDPVFGMSLDEQNPSFTMNPEMWRQVAVLFRHLQPATSYVLCNIHTSFIHCTSLDSAELPNSALSNPLIAVWNVMTRVILPKTKPPYLCTNIRAGFPGDFWKYWKCGTSYCTEGYHRYWVSQTGRKWDAKCFGSWDTRIWRFPEMGVIPPKSSKF